MIGPPNYCHPACQVCLDRRVMCDASGFIACPNCQKQELTLSDNIIHLPTKAKAPSPAQDDEPPGARANLPPDKALTRALRRITELEDDLARTNRNACAAFQAQRDAAARAEIAEQEVEALRRALAQTRGLEPIAQ